MPPRKGTKRAAPQRDASEDPESSDPEPRRRRTASDDEDEADESAGTQQEATQNLARKLVRYALSCEYSRQPIRQAGVMERVIPKTAGRVFKNVFSQAQEMLREVFGMELVELPGRERVSVKEKRAAATQTKASAGTKSWILTSTLPMKYRQADIIPPPQVPTAEAESAYIALYTFVIATIYLAGGTLDESKLERYLRRTNADRNTPIDKRDKLFQRMIREQYIVKIRNDTGNQEEVEYMVGPRGKIEVGEEGVAGVVRKVYGGGVEDLEKRLDRSLGISAQREKAFAGTALGTQVNGNGVEKRAKANGQRGRRRREASGGESEDGED